MIYRMTAAKLAIVCYSNKQVSYKLSKHEEPYKHASEVETKL